MEDDPAAAIRDFIRADVLEDDTAPDLPSGAPLLTGLLDSFALMQLLAFLEERFDITIANKEVVKANFGTIDTLVAFVVRKRLAAAHSGSESGTGTGGGGPT